MFPSCLPIWPNLAAETADSMVCGADMVHFDVMDGHFVPNITYGAPVLKCLKKGRAGSIL